MVSHPDLFRLGQGVTLRPKALAAYRNDILVHRTAVSESIDRQSERQDA